MVFRQFHYTKRDRFMPFLLAEILNFQGSTHRIGVGSFSILEKEGEGGQGEKKGYCLLVRDDGVGVPEKKLPFIFEEFYRGDESRNKKEGNGLGLYIVKYLVEAMGGRVRAENAGGLCIHMWFPISSEKERTKNNGKKDIDY